MVMICHKGLNIKKVYKILPALVVFILLTVPIAVFITTTNMAKATSGTPLPGSVIYQEDFSSGTVTGTSSMSTPVGLNHYTGGVDANNMTYTSANDWAYTSNRCNGWILNFNSAQPTVAQDSGCDTNAGQDGNANAHNAWWFLQRMATWLGIAQGMSTIQDTVTNSNNVVASMTNGSNAQPQTLQFQTAAPLNVGAGHYYVVSAWFAQAHCNSAAHPTWTNAQEHLDLVGTLTNGTTWSSTMPVVIPCVTGTQYTMSQNTPVYIQEGKSAPILLPSNINLSSVSITINNMQTSYIGNDVAFDTVKLTDVTPQLYKEFTPTTIQRGAITTLTYNITNTAELAAKSNWNFTDNLPTGVTAISTPMTGSGAAACGNFSGTINGTSVVVSGDLAANQTFCTVSVQVKVASAVTYTNGSANFPSTTTTGPSCNSGTGLGLCGVLSPADATLVVTPSTLTPDTNNTPFETPITVDVISNDTVPTGSTVTAVTPASPIQGSWTISGGSIVFTPANGFSGVAQATYEVTLPDGSTLTTTVTINVAPSPTIPILVPDTGITPYETPKTINVLTNDTVEDGSVVTGITPNDPTQGTWTFAADGTIVFTPAVGFSGTAIATYEVTYPDNTTGMSTITITVLSPSTTKPPVEPPTLPDTGYLMQKAAVSSGIAAAITIIGISTVLLIRRKLKSR